MKNKINKTQNQQPIRLHLKQGASTDKLRAKIEQTNSKIAYLLKQRAELLADLMG
jgi:hypothetical protein